jgi:hypothetical protein
MCAGCGWKRRTQRERESKGEEKSSVGNVEGIRKKKKRGEEEDGRKKRLFGAVRS